MAAAAAAPSRLRRVLKLGLGSAIVGGGLGAALYRDRLKQNRAVTAEDVNAAQNQEQLQAALSWVQRVASTANGQPVPAGPKVEFFRYTTCPYCGKAKAFLDYFRLPHDSVEVEPMFKSQISGFSYKKVPQLRFGGEGGVMIVDSDSIVEALAEKVGVGSQLQDSDIQKWRTWARESLVRLLVVNINKTLLGAWQGYDYIDAFDSIPLANKLFLKVMGAPVMYLVSEYKTAPTLKKAGELKDGDNVREVLHRHVNSFVSELGLGERRLFHGGSKPDLADLDVYGVLQSVRGHKVYDELISGTTIGPWLTRMDAMTGKQPYKSD